MVTTISDIALVARVVMLHDNKAFDSLVNRYQGRIRRFFLGQTLGDRQLSDDLAQETFIKAYVSLGSFRRLSGFSTWLYRIACNVHYDYVRQHKITQDVDSLPRKAAVRLPTAARGSTSMPALTP